MVENEDTRERWQVLAQLDDWLERPMAVLGFVWLVLLVVELTRGLNPMLEGISLAIWGLFALDFLLRLALAPDRGRFLRGNLLTAVSLALPALRILRAARALRLLRAGRAVRGLSLVRMVATVNRSMKALASTLQRRLFGYVAALTTLVTVVGAAGMLAFERALPGEPGFASYAEALWWTAMLLTSIGSEYWPRTAEGRVLSLLLALYGFAVFGYLAAALASFFIGRDAESESAELLGRRDAEELRREIRALREAMERGSSGAPDGG